MKSARKMEFVQPVLKNQGKAKSIADIVQEKGKLGKKNI